MHQLLTLKTTVYKIPVQFLFFFLFIYLSCNPYRLPDNWKVDEDDQASSFYALSKRHFDEGNYQQALYAIDQAISRNQNLATFYLLKGDIYRKMFLWPQALDAYQQAVEKRSNYIDAYERIGDIRKSQRRYEEALRAYKKVLVTDPQAIDMFLKIASCYLRMDEMELALTNLDNYARNNKGPVEGDYYLIRATVLFIQSDYQNAIDLLSKANTNSEREQYLLGRCYFGLGAYEKGVTYFNRLLKSDPDNGLWYHYRGVYFYNKNDYSDALTQFELALKLDAELIDVHYYLAKIHESKGNMEGALREFRLYRKKMGSVTTSDQKGSNIDFLEERHRPVEEEN